jgi:hypothetical protein
VNSGLASRESIVANICRGQEVVVYCLCMRANHPSKLPGSLISAMFAFVVIAGSLGQAFADSKPFFNTAGSDISTGGWYANGAICSVGGKYQSPQNPNPPISTSANKAYYGGLMGFADGGARRGASSDLGAFSLGNIDANQAAGSMYGFYTGPAGAAPANNGTRSLSFANTGTGINSNTNWGGSFEGTFLQSNCIPDYYGTKQNTSPAPASSFPGVDGADGQYLVSGTPYPLGGGTVPAGKNIALFVNGDVYISGNIRYGAHTASTSPKFVLVARGNIYIDPSVSQLDGWYIAQAPAGGTSTTNDGKIWTCHDSSSAKPTDKYVRARCIDSPLTVNGSLTAKEVILDRVTNGNNIPGASAEVINYIPEMVMGGPFFGPPPATNTAPIQSLISLPPVF